MILHCYVLSRKTQVGFGNTRLNDHFFQKLGVHFPMRGTGQKEERTETLGEKQ